jgi:hypothetical protein
LVAASAKLLAVLLVLAGGLDARLAIGQELLDELAKESSLDEVEGVVGSMDEGFEEV